MQKALNKARTISVVYLYLFSTASVLIALFSFCAESQNNSNFICRYTATDFRFNESVLVTFSVDSAFLKIRQGSGCFDDVSICHVFGNEKVSIVINSDFRSKKGKHDLSPSLTEIGELIKIKINDAYLDRKINEPKLLFSRVLEGVFIRSNGKDDVSIHYIGYTQNPFVYFDIKIYAQSDVDINNILLSIINSISIQEI